MNRLGIDFGDVRVGLALARDGEFPIRMQVVKNDEHLLGRISYIIDKHDIKEIVLGLPRNLDGEDTQQTKKVRKFGKELEKHFQVPIVLQDEADTSSQARIRLRVNGFNQEEIEKWVDSEAAVMILEDRLGA